MGEVSPGPAGGGKRAGTRLWTSCFLALRFLHLSLTRVLAAAASWGFVKLERESTFQPRTCNPQRRWSEGVMGMSSSGPSGGACCGMLDCRGGCS